MIRHSCQSVAILPSIQSLIGKRFVFENFLIQKVMHAKTLMNIVYDYREQYPVSPHSFCLMLLVCKPEVSQN
jgi:hypothetical protein